ncbi:MAG: SDR family oxidoreductase [Gemmatimonadaceae bacterium]
MASDPKRRQTALITGASAGIGAELARVFAAHNHDLVLVARRRDALEALAGALEGKHAITATVIVDDLGDPEAPERIFAAVRDARIDVDVLVNNAGFGLGGEFSETPIDREMTMVQVNVTSLMQLTKLFVAPMLRRRAGYVMNVASTAAFFPGPMMSVYYASKAFVLSFSQALSEELSTSGIVVSCLCPGPTETEFAEVAKMKTVKLFALDLADARGVAEFGYRAMMAGWRVAVPGTRNKLLVQAQRFVPRRLIARAVKKLQDSRM